uniref:Uncharacterized protein n=1 Tax=Aegilops tauschii subsp. strangulata TaxID=200361 RepID=A0A453CRN9_AEGTS
MCIILVRSFLGKKMLNRAPLVTLNLLDQISLVYLSQPYMPNLVFTLTQLVALGKLDSVRSRTSSTLCS